MSPILALIDDQGEYILNGYNVITQYPRVFPYGGVTFEYTGTNSTMERVNTTFARQLKRELTIEVCIRIRIVTISHHLKNTVFLLFLDFISKRALYHR